jgi:uncharacterized protein (DUF1778 family)
MPRGKPIRQINLRITEKQRQQLEAAAERRGISTNQLMRQLLEDALKNENKAQSLEKRVHNLEEGRWRRFEWLESRVTNLENRVVVFEPLRTQQDQKEGGKK